MSMLGWIGSYVHLHPYHFLLCNNKTSAQIRFKLESCQIIFITITIYLVFRREQNLFCKYNTLILTESSPKPTSLKCIKFSEFLIDNLFVTLFDGRVFQQTVAIPVGVNCSLLLFDQFLYSYETRLHARASSRIQLWHRLLARGMFHLSYSQSRPFLV